MTLPGGKLVEVERELRLVRLQLDQLTGSLPPRLRVLEQAFHDLARAVADGLGQVRQQAMRTELRLDQIQGGLDHLRREMTANTDAILGAISGQRSGPG